jgi:hypothetical protein
MDLSNGLDTEDTLSLYMNTETQPQSETSYITASSQWVICRPNPSIMTLDLCHHKYRHCFTPTAVHFGASCAMCKLIFLIAVVGINGAGRSMF